MKSDTTTRNSARFFARRSRNVMKNEAGYPRMMHADAVTAAIENVRIAIDRLTGSFSASA